MSEGSTVVVRGNATKRGWAIVTGASSGMGVEFSKQLARRGYDLVLVARRLDRLDALATELKETMRVEAVAISCDLGVPGAAAKLVAELDARKIAPSALVNNAGFGAQGVAIDLPVERMTEMIQLNVASLTELSLIVGKGMASRGGGSIVNVASTAAFQPSPYFAVYAATKAYVLSFSLALNHDLAPRGVHVMALCPGATRTEFFDNGGVKIEMGNFFFMTPEETVRIGMAALQAERPLVVAGWLNKIMSFLSRISPLWIATRTAAFVMKPKARPMLPR